MQGAFGVLSGIVDDHHAASAWQMFPGYSLYASWCRVFWYSCAGSRSRRFLGHLQPSTDGLTRGVSPELVHVPAEWLPDGGK